MYFSALSACFLSNIFKIVPIASTTFKVTSLSSTLYSLANLVFHSKSSPAISIPVNPEPATINVSISFLLAAFLSRLALANMSCICFLIFNASSNDHKVNPFSFTPGTPKNAGSLPVPTTR